MDKNEMMLQIFKMGFMTIQELISKMIYKFAFQPFTRKQRNKKRNGRNKKWNEKRCGIIKRKCGWNEKRDEIINRKCRKNERRSKKVIYMVIILWGKFGISPLIFLCINSER